MRTLLLVLCGLVTWTCGRAPSTCGPSTCAGCCSATGECVSPTSTLACGANGQLCRQCGAFENCQLGVCVNPAGTGGGFVAGGGFVTGGGSATGGGAVTGGGAGGGAMTGGGAVLAGGSATGGGAGLLAPDVLLLIDRSGSMNQPINPTEARGQVLRAAMTSFLQSRPTSARFGVTAFPGDSSCGPPTTQTVPMLAPAQPDSSSVLANQTQLSLSAIGALGTNASMFIGGTPTGLALSFAANIEALQTPGRPRGIVLVTDGLPNCNPNNPLSCMSMPLPPPDLCTLNNPATPGVNSCSGNLCRTGYLDQTATVDSMRTLSALGVRTAVVVLVDAPSLTPQMTLVMNAMADEGRAPKCAPVSSCPQRFFFASSQATLEGALSTAFQLVTQP